MIPLTYLSVNFVQNASEQRQIEDVVQEEVERVLEAELVELRIERDGDELSMDMTLRTARPLYYQDSISLQEAIRRMTSLPATNLKIQRRGLLKEGHFADVVIFDPATIQDHATFEQPHQYATGVEHVFVNGTQVLKDGEHTGATPGRVVRGPGWKP